MTQQNDTDFPIAPTATSGSQLASILNTMNDALLTMRSGASRPTSAQAGTMWLDTSNAATHIVYFYNGIVDIALYEIDVATGDLSYSTINGDLSVTGSIFISDGIFSIGTQSIILSNSYGGIALQQSSIENESYLAQTSNYGAVEKVYIAFDKNGGMELNFNGATKLAIVTGGVTVTGAMSADTIHAGDGVSGTFSNPTSITVVDGIITAIS